MYASLIKTVGHSIPVLHLLITPITQAASTLSVRRQARASAIFKQHNCAGCYKQYGSHIQPSPVHATATKASTAELCQVGCVSRTYPVTKTSGRGTGVKHATVWEQGTSTDSCTCSEIAIIKAVCTASGKEALDSTHSEGEHQVKDAMEPAGPFGPHELICVGDVMLGRLVDESMSCDPNRKEGVWGNILAWVAAKNPSNTIVAGNLECAITDHQQAFPKAFNFRLAPANLDALRHFTCGYVSLANNHILDYFIPGMSETIGLLRRSGIKASGAGSNIQEAERPAVVSKPGLNVAFLSFSDHYHYWAATDMKPGINYINPASYDKAHLQRLIDGVKSSGVDMVVIFIHWGPNWQWEPDVELRQLGHDFIDAGAGMVFGHSAHHIQGVELYKGCPIIYSAGAFLDDYALEAAYRNDLGAVFVAHVEDARVQWLDMYPTQISHIFMPPQAVSSGMSAPYLSEVNWATGADWTWLADKFAELSHKLGTEIQVVRDPVVPAGRHLHVNCRTGSNVAK